MIIQISSDLLWDATSLWENTFDIVDCQPCRGQRIFPNTIIRCADCKHKFKDGRQRINIVQTRTAPRSNTCACGWMPYHTIVISNPLLYFAGVTLARPLLSVHF
jgi:hypothetical protein